MKLRKTRLITVLLLCLCGALAFTLGACQKATDEPKQEEEQAEEGADAVAADTVSYEDALVAYTAAVDTKYGYDLAVEICESGDYDDNDLGDRQAGSDAEHRTAEKIEQTMKEIGLQEVTKDAVKVDRIQANGSKLVLKGDDKEIVLHAYQTTGTPADGLAAEIVDVGKGTAWDYDGIDVKGKIVFIDIDQRAEWWIGTPVTQAISMGAAGVIANNVSGFSEIATDAYNANDFCGPATIPTVSITQDDAKYVRKAMKDGVVEGVLTVNNEFEEGKGESYNVWGKIPGKDSSEAILFGAHYDAYFQGFQDDTIAWTGVLTIAKAMIDSGYQPERDIIFMAHGAEEWGTANSSYDWAVGSYREITEARDDWQGKILSFINFELNAADMSDYTYSESVPEMNGFLKDFTEAETTPQPSEEVYPDGIATDGFQVEPYTDSFSYYVAGVPSFVNGLLFDVLSEDGEAFPWAYQYYHTNYDTKDTYSEDVYDWSLKYYGALGIKIDKTPALVLDYTAQADRLADALDEEVANEAGADYAGYTEAVGSYATAAKALAEKVADVNARYAAAEPADRAGIWEEAQALNKSNLAIFKQTQDYLLGLSAETPIVPHEWYQDNITLIEQTVGFLNDGDIVSAADETGWAINGGVEWYAENFDHYTVEQGIGTYLGKYASQNWGKGKTYEFADVEDASRALYERYEEKGGDFADEIAIYDKALKSQTELYKDAVAEETGYIGELTEAMKTAAQ